MFHKHNFTKGRVSKSVEIPTFTYHGHARKLEYLMDRRPHAHLVHYRRERNHQGLDNQLVEHLSQLARDGVICRHERLGGMLNYYYREAA